MQAHVTCPPARGRDDKKKIQAQLVSSLASEKVIFHFRLKNSMRPLFLWLWVRARARLRRPFPKPRKARARARTQAAETKRKIAIRNSVWNKRIQRQRNRNQRLAPQAVSSTAWEEYVALSSLEIGVISAPSQ